MRTDYRSTTIIRVVLRLVFSAAAMIMPLRTTPACPAVHSTQMPLSKVSRLRVIVPVDRQSRSQTTVVSERERRRDRPERLAISFDLPSTDFHLPCPAATESPQPVMTPHPRC